ncbi:MAG: MBL fold metallo-hydrolase [Armatimonadota bacterium]|nr:MBL fold metallo-hydrolase [Armatimonadota bacterium]
MRRLVVGELQTNCFILADDEGDAVIIDPGEDPERIEKTIHSYELTPRYILCTHGHADHTFAAGRLQSSFDVEVLIHELDRPLIDEGLGELAFIFDVRKYEKPTLGPALSDGQILEVGSMRLQVIHTPGHTPGGVSLLCGSDLFSGDTLFAGGVGRTDLPGGSQDELLRSIRGRLLVLDDDTRVYPGHGPETTIGEERQSNPWLRGGS